MKKGFITLPVLTGIILVLALGAVFLIIVQRASAPASMPAPTEYIFTDNGKTDSQNSSQTKTYTNAQYHFSFEYPSDLQVISEHDGSYAIEMPKTNAVLRGYVHLYIHNDIDKDCLNLPKESDTMSVEGGTFPIKINGATFTTYSTYIEGGEVPNLIAVDDFYKTVHNGACYILILGGQGSYDEGAAARDPRRVAMEDIKARLSSVVSTFRFTDDKAPVLDYTGNWFKVEYPSNFVPRPRATVGNEVKTDEAFFMSPDGAIEFYVFSPYTFDTSAYENPLSNESVISDTSKTENIEPNYLSPRITRWITFEAKDGSYKRSLVSIKESVFDQPNQYGQDAQFHRIFGIKYKDQASYDKYLPQYLEFKKSLVQYAD